MSAIKIAFTKTWSFVKGFPAQLLSSRKTLIVTVLVVLVAGFFGWRYLATGKKSGGYTTAKAAYGDVMVTISASGNVTAVQNLTLTFKSQGYVQSCSVKLGDKVKAGQVLAEEQDSDLRSALEQAQASLESAQASYDKLVSTGSQRIAQAQAQVDQVKGSLDMAKSTLERDKQLLAIGAISQADLDAAQNSYQSALYQYQSAQLNLAQVKSPADQLAAAAQVKNAQAQASTAQDNLNNARMVAPFDGYISTVSGNAGQWTGSGTSSSSSTTQFSVVMTSLDLQIDANINEADISKVSVGQAVTFTVDTYPNQTFTGKIIALSPSASTVSNVQMYQALISIDDYSKLKSGLPASINIITASANHVIVITQSALTYGRTYMASQASAMTKGSGINKTAAGQSGSSTGSSPASQGGSTASQVGTNSSQNGGVVVVLVNGQPQIKRVQTGLTDDVNVEIKSGLTEGDTVVTGSSTATSNLPGLLPPAPAGLRIVDSKAAGRRLAVLGTG